MPCAWRKSCITTSRVCCWKGNYDNIGTANWTLALALQELGCEIKDRDYYEEKADFAITLAGAGPPYEGAKLNIYWATNDPLYTEFPKKQIQDFDIALTTSKSWMPLYAEMGLEVFFFPQFAPSYLIQPSEQRTTPLIYVGTAYSTRTHILEQLIPRLPSGVTLTWLRKGHTPIPIPELLARYGDAKIALALHTLNTTDDKPVPFNDALTYRHFHATVMGALLLTQDRPGLWECFREDELVTWKILDECIDKINHFLMHEEERATIARKGQERVLKEHLASHRAKQLLEIVRDHSK